MTAIEDFLEAYLKTHPPKKGEKGKPRPGKLPEK